ncbi:MULTISPECIES: hypothetical protein [Streptomyces]|uniref:Uncharacterized protein n=1 Tax=Streptomyces changanensis TaxID=2964669 RepID=A0ABY5N6P2_9ACTN|nr:MULTISPECIES: hypothetical protein [Streptomyces]UUS32202.1 hypothetical protein NRO40_16195 [Streptomyces changanensis]
MSGVEIEPVGSRAVTGAFLAARRDDGTELRASAAGVEGIADQALVPPEGEGRLIHGLRLHVLGRRVHRAAELTLLQQLPSYWSWSDQPDANSAAAMSLPTGSRRLWW